VLNLSCAVLCRLFGRLRRRFTGTTTFGRRWRWRCSVRKSECGRRRHATLSLSSMSSLSFGCACVCLMDVYACVVASNARRHQCVDSGRSGNGQVAVPQVHREDRTPRRTAAARDRLFPGISRQPHADEWVPMSLRAIGLCDWSGRECGRFDCGRSQRSRCVPASRLSFCLHTIQMIIDCFLLISFGCLVVCVCVCVIV
jgi:hypothetical protein